MPSNLKPQVSSFKPILAALVLIIYIGLHLWALAETPLSDDADFYLSASEKYKEWIKRIVASELSIANGGERDAYFKHNREHPPLAKYLMALSDYIFREKLNLFGQIDASRIGIVFASAFLALLLFLWASEVYGKIAAISAPLILLFLPRFFFHSHLETLDVAIAAFYFFTVFSFWKAQKSNLWAFVTGFAFGLALLTKLNAPFVLLPLSIYWLALNRRKISLSKHLSLTLPPIPLSFLSMLFLGVPLFFLLWPWLWHSTFSRLYQYLEFHLNHYGILFYYLGKIYHKEFAPWHAPFVMAIVTTPLSIFLLFLAGAARQILRILKPSLRLPKNEREEHSYEMLKSDFLILLNLFFTIAVVAFSGSPFYSGVKLFLPFFPFLALSAAVALSSICGGVVEILRIKRDCLRNSVTAFVVAVALALPAYKTLSIHPYQLSYYSELIGGLKGAVKYGFEIQYYDLFYKELVRFINRELPSGATIFFAPNNKEYVRQAPWYLKENFLRSDIRIVNREADADYFILTHEERWHSYRTLLKRWSGKKAIYELRVEDVALLSVYKTRDDLTK
ncbi:MAG: hypothetical protein Kow0090_17730 [Myxococcota bacterium]